MDGSLQQVSYGIWRCMICGEVFLAGQCATHCPFCGAHGENFVRVEDVTKLPPEDLFNAGGELTEREKENLRASITTELLNTAFYEAMNRQGDRSTATGTVLSRTYKRLAQIEDEHAGIFCKFLGVDKKKQQVPPELLSAHKVTGVWKDDIAASVIREENAHALYSRFATETDKPRLKLVWTALADVEHDHVVIETQQGKLLDAAAARS